MEGDTNEPVFDLSETVTALGHELGDTPVAAGDLVIALLTRHPDYGPGVTAALQIDVGEEQEQRPFPKWLSLVSALYDPQETAQIDGRLIILGLAILDHALFATLEWGGFLLMLWREMGQPYEVILLDDNKELVSTLSRAERAEESYAAEEAVTDYELEEIAYEMEGDFLGSEPPDGDETGYHEVPKMAEEAGAPPDPREPLPTIDVEVGEADHSVVAGQIDTGGGDVITGDVDKSEGKTVFDQSGQTVHGGQVNIGEIDGGVGQIGDVVHGDKVEGDIVSGDKITVGDISGSGAVAIGRDAEATHISSGRGDAEKSAEDRPIKQARRLEAAMPESVRVNETTELLVMLPRRESEGLRAELPIETVGGEIIDKDDVSERDTELRFPAPDIPLVVYLQVTAAQRDFEVEDPFRGVLVYPDRDSDFETFYLTPLRPAARAPVTVRLYEDEGRTMALSSLRLSTSITGDEDDAQLAVLSRTVALTAASGPVTINYSYVGGDNIHADISNSTGVAIGENAVARVSGINAGDNRDDLYVVRLFTPLLTLVARDAPGDIQAAKIADVQLLQEEVERGSRADDTRVATLVQNIVEGVPSAGVTLVALFADDRVATAVGQTTRFVLSRLA